MNIPLSHWRIILHAGKQTIERFAISRTAALFLAAAATGIAASIATVWFELPLHWYPAYFTGAPVLGLLLVFLYQELRNVSLERRCRNKKPEELEKFVVSVRYIDEEWHEVFEQTDMLLEQAIELFSETVQDLYEVVGDQVEGTNWRYKGITEICAESLRIADSVLCQLRSGHPDTAMGTVRQLFELMTFQELIAMDESGMVAKRYQDFSEWSYLKDLIGTDVSNKPDLGKRKGMIEKEYPEDTNLGARFGWINPANGKNLDDMKGVIKYLVKRRIKDSSERKRAQNFYQKHWANLNSWTHISKPASRRKLGIRTTDGYERAHLLEKSRSGMDTPLSMAVVYLRQTILTFEATAFHLTNSCHQTELENIQRTIDNISRALDSVTPELLANDFRITLHTENTGAQES